MLKNKEYYKLIFISGSDEIENERNFPLAAKYIF